MSALTAVDLAALAHDALSAAGLSTASVSLSMQLTEGGAHLSFAGPGEGWTQEEASRLIAALRLKDQWAAAAGNVSLGDHPDGVHVAIHHQVKQVPA